jgi:hypothetical protein
VMVVDGVSGVPSVRTGDGYRRGILRALRGETP